jgi:hypothetical protein
MLHACGTLKPAPDDDTTGVDGGGPEAGAPGTDGGSLPDGCRAATTFNRDPSAKPKSSMTIDGDALHYHADGDGTARATSQFSFQPGAKHFVVTFDYAMTFSGSWGVSGDPYVDLVGIAFGPDTQGFPTVRATFSPSDSVFLNVFVSSGDGNPMAAPKSTGPVQQGQGTMTLDVDFETANGSASFNMGSATDSATFSGKTASTTDNVNSQITVVLGGGAAAQSPTTDVLFKNVCVSVVH